MIIITSAAYVDSEFRSEVGKLPPVMLPVGNKRLLEYQVDILREKLPDECIFLTLPDDYSLSIKDVCFIERHHIVVVQIPGNIPLSDSILFAVNYIGKYDNDLFLLHGDTLIYDLPVGKDIVAISSTNNDYEWEVVDENLCEEVVWSGYFTFSDIRKLAKCLTVSLGDFSRAMKMYHGDSKVHYKEVMEWYDFGHINNYFISRSKMPSKRFFNKITVDGGVITKSSAIKEKIIYEKKWFESVPEKMKIYTPQIIGFGVNNCGESYYKLEYMSYMPLNEIFVHALNPPFFWYKIFGHLKIFLMDCVQSYVEMNENACDVNVIEDSASLLVNKTKRRLMDYVADSEVDFDAPVEINGIEFSSLNYVVNDCISRIGSDSSVVGVFHGDLCLSNILYDFRGDKIKVIDPRAMDSKGRFSYLGDLKYDLAKLNHSIIGLYDHIVSGGYDLKVNHNEFKFDILIDDRIKEIQSYYIETMSFMGITPKDLMPDTILLFFSMLPLHSDDCDRQNAFIANALRLYQKYMVTN